MKITSSYSTLIILLLSLFSNVLGQTWIKTYNYDNTFGNGSIFRDSAKIGSTEMTVAADGCIYALNCYNMNRDMELIKIDSLGGFLWSIPVAYGSGNYIRLVNSLHPTNDSGCVYLYTNLSAGLPTIYRVNYISSNGLVKWSNTYNSPIIVKDVCSTNYSTVIIQFNDSLVEVDANGNFIQQRFPFSGSITPLGTDLIVSNSSTVSRQSFGGTIIWSIPVFDYIPFYADSSYTFLKHISNETVIKLQSSNGSILWNKLFHRNGISVTPDMGLITTNNDSIIRYDASGNLQWKNVFSFPVLPFRQILAVSPNRFITGGAYRCMQSSYMPSQNVGYASFFASVDSTGHGVIDSTTSFFVGNANDNYTVTFADDAASIGVALNSFGSSRDSAFNFFAPPNYFSKSVYGTEWSQVTGLGINYKYSDIDGNGLVNTDDVLYMDSLITYPSIVWPHWRLQSHSLDPELRLVVEEDTLLPGSIGTIDVILASPSLPIDSIYSLSFSINSMGNLMTTPASSFTSSTQFGDTAINLYSYYSLFGYPNFLLARTDHQNVQITGDTIIKFTFTTGQSTGMVPVGITGSALTEKGYPVSFNFIGDSVYVPLTTGMNLVEELEIIIFPNPASDKISFNAGNENILAIKMTDSYGRIVKSEKDLVQSNIDVSMLKGFYLFEVKTNKGINRKKVLIGNWDK